MAMLVMASTSSQVGACVKPAMESEYTLMIPDVRTLGR